ncbi:DUF6279 family lipoprotein [Alcanivorax sp. JB21]|uniref:DUF6279 family lipoprotein n=1 Tax=Alcanivorax limicola TaxID=2874102 RepID=UPI001CBE59B7|nr:DUF6279 family lipoprotein [Alcanivorax limicola]MBZ2188743.1 DUF6279 family lipoprotein [Alcanivorax limicola]
MTQRPGWWWHLVAALCCAVLLAGCHRVDIAYERGDWFVARWAGGLLDLDRDQRQAARALIQDYRDGPGRARAGELAALLDALRDTLSADELTSEALAVQRAALAHFGRDLSGDLIPGMVTVLSTMRPEQVRHLSGELEAMLEEEAARDTAARQSRLYEAVSRWTGRLDTAQERLLDDCIAQMPEAWHRQRAWRADMNAQLIALLDDAADAPALTAYFQARYQLRPDQRPEEIALLQREGVAVMQGCLVQLHPTLTTRQRERVLGRLDDYRDALQRVARRSDSEG